VVFSIVSTLVLPLYEGRLNVDFNLDAPVLVDTDLEVRDDFPY
jgi:hypothetical protein